MLATLRTVLLLPLFRLVWTLLLALGLFQLLAWLAPNLARLSNLDLAGSARNALLTTVVLALSVSLFERRSLRDIGLSPARAIPQISGGFLFGAALLTTVVAFLALMGSYTLLGWAPLPAGTSRGQSLLRFVLLFFCAGVFEELAFRGILFRLVEQGLGTWLALGISAVLFGFGHRHNPGATVLSSVAIAIEAGALFAAIYVATRSLWLPIGLHWAWNLFEGPVWGSSVSGIGTPVLADARFLGPALLTGGPFGPEAGLPTIVLGGALAIAFLAVAIRRGQIVTPRWIWWLLERVRPLRLPAPVSIPASAPTPAVPPLAS
jgi:membrane protease YdiL (CAAX protease family)